AMDQARQALGQRLRELDRVLRSLAGGEGPWRAFLLWPQTLSLTSGEPLAPAVLDRLETRWSNAIGVWDRTELVDASLAVRSIVPQWLRSQFTYKIDEPYQVDTVIVGARTTGSGRLLGGTSCELLPSNGVGRWVVRFDGVSNDATIGLSDGARVRSHATTRIH